jgi:autotransporter-associated beta strand protein
LNGVEVSGGITVGTALLILNGSNSFTGGVLINVGTLQLGNPGALNSSAPNAVTFAEGSTGGLSLNGNSVTISGLNTGTPAGTPVVQNGASTPAALTVSNASDNTFAGALQDGLGGGALSFVKSGAGTLTLSGSKAYTGNTTVSAGTLRFALTSGSPTVGAGSTATLSSGATLELAGIVSALSSASNRVNVSNSSSAPGLLVSGTNQQVGNIDGTGTTQVNAGSDLTANHIIQGALVIGGMAKNPGLVTIDASDASGNPLAIVGLAATTSIPNTPMGARANLTDPLSYVTNGDSLATSSPPLVSSETVAPAAIPERSSLFLFFVGGLAVAGAAVRRRRRN